MNMTETASLLSFIRGLRLVKEFAADELTVVSWQAVLHDVSLEDAQAAVVAHYRGPRGTEFLTVAHVFQEASKLTPNRERIAADVRSARARSIVARDWPEDRPLDEESQARLDAARLLAVES